MPDEGRVLVVEREDEMGGPITDRWPGCKPAVHGDYLAVIGRDGEIAGYQTWRRWWYVAA